MTLGLSPLTFDIKNLTTCRILKVIPYTKFKDFGVIRFWHTDTQTPLNAFIPAVVGVSNNGPRFCRSGRGYHVCCIKIVRKYCSLMLSARWIVAKPTQYRNRIVSRVNVNRKDDRIRMERWKIKVRFGSRGFFYEALFVTIVLSNCTINVCSEEDIARGWPSNAFLPSSSRRGLGRDCRWLEIVDTHIEKYRIVSM